MLRTFFCSLILIALLLAGQRASAGASIIVFGDFSDTIANDQGLVVAYVEYPISSEFYGEPFPSDMLPEEIVVHFADGESVAFVLYSYIDALEGYEYTLVSSSSYVVGVIAEVDHDWPGEIVVSTAPGHQGFYDHLPLYLEQRQPKEGKDFHGEEIIDRH